MAKVYNTIRRTLQLTDGGAAVEQFALRFSPRVLVIDNQGDAALYVYDSATTNPTDLPIAVVPAGDFARIIMTGDAQTFTVIEAAQASGKSAYAFVTFSDSRDHFHALRV